jgi:hypothetical protein
VHGHTPAPGLSPVMGTRLAAFVGLLAASAAMLGPARTAAEPDQAANDAVGFGGPTSAPLADDAVGFGEPAPLVADDAVGFGEPSPASRAAAKPSPSEPARSSSPWAWTGNLATQLAFWTERLQVQPLSRARGSVDTQLRYARAFGASGRTSLRLSAAGHVEYDAAYLAPSAPQDPATLETYRFQVFSRESYVALTPPHVELSTGWQVAAMGQGELFGALDVLNPRDLRDPALTAPDDIRMSALMSKLKLFFDAYEFEAIVVHQASFGLMPPPASDLSPLRPFLTPAVPGGAELAAKTWRYEHRPDGFSPSVWQYFGHWSMTFSSVDLDFAAGSVLDRRGVPRLPGPFELAQASIYLDLYHPRYWLAATSGAVTIRKSVVRWEFVGELERPQTMQRAGSLPLDLYMRRMTQLNALVGLTYFGIPNGNLSVEVARAVVLASDDLKRELFWPIEAWSLNARYMHSFLRQRLRVSLVCPVIGLPHVNGWLARGEVSYAMDVGVRLELGYVVYRPSAEPGPLYGFDAHDRAYFNLRWDFAIL